MSIQLQIPAFATVTEDASNAEESTGSRRTTERKPRDYQRRIASQALGLLSQRRSPLIVAATGVGKSFIGSLIVSECGLRTLWLVHRIELVHQAAEALERATGERVGYELPGRYSGEERIVVASRDTFRRQGRVDRAKNFAPFGLILIDEAHHVPCRGYRDIISAYPDALRLGLTATPGRLDKRQLAAFDSSTEPFGIVEASAQGWLVPIRAKRERVSSVDLSGVKTSQGDFDRAELDAIMRSEASTHAIAQAILERLSHGPALSFATSVAAAERQAEVLNRYRPGVARYVTGTTPDLERAGLFREFGRAYQVLVNVGVATEGTDLPAAAVIAMGRPTKSTALFQQMLGRGLRPLPGTVDTVGSALSRLEAIAASAKPFCLVLDFVGVTGKHSVATALDGLGSNAPAAVSERLRARLDAGEELDVASALAGEIEAEQARLARNKERRKKDQERRAALVGSVVIDSEDVRLIGLGGNEQEPDGPVMDGAPTVSQVSWMSRLGIDFAAVKTAREARNSILEARKVLDLASPKQLALISKHRPVAFKPDLTRKQAGFLISQITRNWR